MGHKSESDSQVSCAPIRIFFSVEGLDEKDKTFIDTDSAVLNTRITRTVKRRLTPGCSQHILFHHLPDESEEIQSVCILGLTLSWEHDIHSYISHVRRELS